MSDPGTTTTTDPPADPPDPNEVDTTDWKAEFEKLQKDARKHEDRAKANINAARELEQLRRSSLTEQEQAVAAAREEAAKEVRNSYGGRLVDAEVKAAAAGRAVDVEALLEGLDRSRFLDDDGEPKVDEIVAWIDRVVPVGDGKRPPVDLGQGVRPVTAANVSPGSAQLERDLKAALGIS